MTLVSPHIVGWPLVCGALVDFAERTPLGKLLKMSTLDMLTLLPRCVGKYVNYMRSISAKERG